MDQLRRFGRLLVILVGACLAAYAAEPTGARAGNEVPVVAALCDAFAAKLGVRPAYRRVKKSKDGTITIRGLTTEIEQAPAADRKIKATLSVERITLSGITEQNGLFDVAEVKLTNLILISDDDAETSSALRLPEVVLAHLYLKPSGNLLAAGGSILPLGSQAQSLLAKDGVFSSGGTSLQFGLMEASWQGDPDTGLGQTHLRIDDIRYPASAIRRSDPSGTVLSLLGGGDLVFDLAGSGGTTADGGAFDVALTLRSLGVFRLAGRLASPILGVLASASGSSQSDATVPAPQPSEMMIKGFTLRYEDHSLTGKLLAMLAADQGVDQEKLVANTTAALEQGLTAVQNQTLTEQLKTSVQTYLASPRSFTVRAELAQPASVVQLVESAASGPAAFLSQFPISIAAND
jgi:hypothetical protein